MRSVSKLWPLVIVAIGMALLLYLAGCVSDKASNEDASDDIPIIYDSPREGEIYIYDSVPGAEYQYKEEDEPYERME